MTPPRDPRLRRQQTHLMHGAHPPVDALAAAVRLDLAMDAMRAQQLGRGPADLATGVQFGTVDPPLTAAEFAAALGPVDDDDAMVVPPAVSVPPTPPAPFPIGETATYPVDSGDPLEHLTHTIAEEAPPGLAAFSSERSLSWRSRHDVRSLSYGIRPRLAGSAPLADRMWPAPGRVLDQGEEGACVGMAIINAAEAMGIPEADDEGDALELYRRAQQLDGSPAGTVGASVLAGMKAAVEAGYIGGYLWAFGTRDVAQTVLQRGPVVVGVPWLSGMYDTGPGGLVQLEGDDEGLGHCLTVVGIRLKGPQGQPGPFFVWENSWGSGYGDGGLGYIHHRDLASLLRGVGEAAIPTAAPVR